MVGERLEMHKRQKMLFSARPPGVAAGLAKVVFHIAELLLQGCNLFFLGVGLVSLGIDLSARILLVHRFGRVRVILQVGLIDFALQDFVFKLGIGNFLALGGEFLAPRGFGIWRFLFFAGIVTGRSGGILSGGRTGGGGSARRSWLRRDIVIG